MNVTKKFLIYSILHQKPEISCNELELEIMSRNNGKPLSKHTVRRNYDDFKGRTHNGPKVKKVIDYLDQNYKNKSLVSCDKLKIELFINGIDVSISNINLARKRWLESNLKATKVEQPIKFINIVIESVLRRGLRASSNAILKLANKIVKRYIDEIDNIEDLEVFILLPDGIVEGDPEYLVEIGEINNANFGFGIQFGTRKYVNLIRKKIQRRWDLVYDLRTHEDVPDRNMFEPMI